MKKLISLILALALVLSFAACAGNGGNNSQTDSKPENSQTESAPDNSQTGSDPAPAPNYATVGEIYAAAGSLDEYCVEPSVFAALFTLDGVVYRVEAESSEEVFDRVTAIDYSDPDYDDKVKAIFSSLKVTEVLNLTAGVPTEAELAAYVGKTGRELLDDGFELGFGDFDLEETTYFLYKDYYQFRFTFNEKIEYSDNIDDYATLLNLTVKTAAFEWYHS